VAVVQLEPQPADHGANLALIERALADHGARSESGYAGDVDLVVFPEYALTGCPSDDRLQVALSQAETPAWHGRLIELARHYKTHLVVGYAEQSGGQIFSAALLVGPAGIGAYYRKTHVVGPEAAWCSPGTEKPPVVDLPLGRVGLLIGTDLCFPEPPRSLAIEGCDLVAVAAGPGLPPTLTCEPAPIPPGGVAAKAANPYHFHLARQRALENNCNLAFASLPLPHGIGSSAVFGPAPAYRDGETILPANDTGVAVGTIDTTNLDMPYPSAMVRMKDLVRMRQTYLYDPLQMLAKAPARHR
jgi:predicted amidohydrolase